MRRRWGGGGTGPRGVAVSLVIDPDGLTLIVRGQGTLTADVRDASNIVLSNSVVWSSLSQQVATVNSGGVVTGVTVGTTQVVAADGAAADTVVVVVVDPGGAPSCDNVASVTEWRST